jgi:hypothetical protein
MANNRVRPPKESTPGKDVHHAGGHFDQGFYTDGPFGPALGGVSGSFPVEDQFRVRPSASQPEAAPQTASAPGFAVGATVPAGLTPKPMGS